MINQLMKIIAIKYSTVNFLCAGMTRECAGCSYISLMIQYISTSINSFLYFAELLAELFI